jgi:hypothetical protein
MENTAMAKKNVVELVKDMVEKQAEQAGVSVSFANGHATVQTGTAAQPGIYNTAEEARTAGKPEGRAKWKLWQVDRKDAATRFTWADCSATAFRLVAQADGYSARCLDGKPANPALVSGLLASLTEADRNALLAQYLKAQ